MADVEKALAPFTVRGTPLLAAGNTMELLGRAQQLWAHVKVYADGGENGLHLHPDEDHLFFVLGGEATFRDEADGTTVVGVNEGVVVPRGTPYSFSSSGAGNLVMLRVGAGTADEDHRNRAEATAFLPAAMAVRVAVDGSARDGLGPENRTGAIAGVPIPGRFFGSSS